MNDVNNVISEVREAKSEISWDDVAVIVNYKCGTDLTGNACRKRHARRHPRIETSVYKRHNYKENVPVTTVGDCMIIPDIHAPFVLEGALDFLVNVKREYNISDDNVFGIGDFWDGHAISYHEKDPDGFSSGNELAISREFSADFMEEFPVVKFTLGNHDSLPTRRAVSQGISRQFMAELNEVYDAPDTWEWHYSYIINDNILMEHGASSGLTATHQRAMFTGMNVIQGHTHSYGGVIYVNDGYKMRWALNVGTLADQDTYAMLYSKRNKYKHTYGCGAIINGIPMFIPFYPKKSW